MASSTTTNGHTDSVPHVERTAGDPRQEGLHRVFVSDVREVNEDVRIVRLGVLVDEPPIRHSPGQWLDVHIPSISQVGGFTITSPPSTALLAPLTPRPYLELCIQRSPSNPPAAFFFRPFSEIVNKEIHVRVGGSFIWPPSTLSKEQVKGLKRVVFIAGGIGINPLISMLSSISEKEKWPPVVRVIYSVRNTSLNPSAPPAPAANATHTPPASPLLLGKDQPALDSAFNLDRIPFFSRLNSIARDAKLYPDTDFQFRLIITGQTTNTGTQTPQPSSSQSQQQDQDQIHAQISTSSHRLTWSELQESVGLGISPNNSEKASTSSTSEKENTIIYICGPQPMTDELVSGLVEREGFERDRVLCEKWW